MTQARAYYEEGGLSTAFYDVLTAADHGLVGDIGVYAGLAPPGATVLELGAGGGRVSFALAARGLIVTGVDLAPAMLRQAEIRRAALPEALRHRVRFQRGDMRTLDLGRTFDLVICPYFTLAHVPVAPAWPETFAVMARHLRPGGLAAVHLPMLAIMSRLGPSDPQRVVFDQPLPSGGRLQLRILERRFDAARSCLDQLVDYAELGRDGAVVRRSPERLTYHMADPAPFATDAGLVLDRPPIDLNGVGEVFVFRKT